jgi:hypothetical protein
MVFRELLRWTGVVVGIAAFVSPGSGQRTASNDAAVVGRYCASCHSSTSKMGGVVLDKQDPARAAEHADLWEKVLRKVRTGQMPPPGLPRPDAASATAFANRLQSTLDAAATARPQPGAPQPHRLNRTEYSNAIRDLLGVDTKPGLAFPVDESGNGFDNMADLLSMSPSLFERYLSAARQISRLAVGDLGLQPVEEIFDFGAGSKVRHLPEELPFNSRGYAFQHYFPVDATFVLRVKLRGGGEGGAPGYEARIPVRAGLHTIATSFPKELARPEIGVPAPRRFGPPGPPTVVGAPLSLDIRLDGVRIKSFQVPQRGNPTEIASVIIGGPFDITGRGDTLSRKTIFACRPSTAAQEDACANTILTNLARRAFRRPATDADLRPLLRFYSAKRAAGGDFDQGIQEALEAMLVSPDFLFRIERAPKNAAPGTVYKLGAHELASRLSFFLWSSIPDEQLLDLADSGKLNNPAVFQAQFHRMLADPKADALAANFGGQWLYLRSLENVKPDPDIFSKFDDSLRRSFRVETELFFGKLVRDDRSVLDLLDADYSLLNDRLAEHYGVRNVYGSHFRKVTFADQNRGGLLGQGSILTVTSYPNRTSVVQRGKWVLENLLGAPPPPPPPDVPDLPAKSKDGRRLSMREAMEQHRVNPVCSSCHSRMDPIGFALENFDGVGAWRTDDAGAPIDTKGKLPDGAQVDGVAGLKKLLRDRYKDEFVETVAEKLLTYALGRSLEATDKPTVRAITRKAATQDYRFSAFLAAIVESTPFQMRRTPEP